MNIFYDLEFTGLHKDTTTISIGLVTDDGRMFYAEFNDYDRSQCNDWIKENVIKHCMFLPTMKNENDTYESRTLSNKIILLNDKKTIRKKLLKWLTSLNDEIQFISDVCHYDFVLLIDILADDALSLPEFISPVCHDLNTDIANHYNVSEKEAFNMSREDIIGDLPTIKGDKHNSLYDARVMKEIYNKIGRV